MTNQAFARMTQRKMDPNKQLFEAQASGTCARVKKDRLGGSMRHSRLDVVQRPSGPIGPAFPVVSQPTVETANGGS